jgi:hypothetical protein
MTHGIVLTHNGIYHHRNQKNKVGGSINQSNNMIRKLSSQVNNPSTAIAGLGSQSDVLSRSAYTPSGTSIVFGAGNLTGQMAKLNFNTNKSKDRNVRLRL